MMRRVLCLLSLVALFSGVSRLARGEDAAARRERFEQLIEALNTSSSGRAPILELIYGELRGQNARDMQEALHSAMDRQNSLILAGVVEVLAMLGDRRDVSALTALLATSDSLEVKTAVIRLLPAFYLTTERSRFNYIHYAAGEDLSARPEILEPLRRPPLTRRGRLDGARDRLQGLIVRSIARQFDPVADALRYLDDARRGTAARRTVTHFVGGDLGNDPGRWAGIWAAQGHDITVRAGDEVEELRLAALRSLSDMGAEGVAEVRDGFAILFTGGGILRQAALDALAVMCRAAYENFALIKTLQFSAEDAVEAENWRQQKYASAAHLAAVAAATAGGVLDGGGEETEFLSAAGCLAAGLSFPPDFPDADGLLARARAAGLERLERLLLMPDISVEKRAALATALGVIGAGSSVRAVMGIIASPYCSPEAGYAGNRMVMAALDALVAAATGGQDGEVEARAALLALLADGRVFPPARPGTPPVGLAYMVLWRLQRLARSTGATLDPAVWKRDLRW